MTTLEAIQKTIIQQAAEGAVLLYCRAGVWTKAVGGLKRDNIWYYGTWLEGPPGTTSQPPEALGDLPLKEGTAAVETLRGSKASARVADRLLRCVIRHSRDVTCSINDGRARGKVDDWQTRKLTASERITRLTEALALPVPAAAAEVDF